MRACGRARAGACSVTRACADESRCVLCRTPVGTRRGRSITGFHKHVAAGLLGQARSAQYRCYLGRARSSGALQSGLERRRLAPARRSEPAQIITRSTAARRASACGDGGVEGLGEAVLDAQHLPAARGAVRPAWRERRIESRETAPLHPPAPHPPPPPPPTHPHPPPPPPRSAPIRTPLEARPGAAVRASAGPSRTQPGATLKQKGRRKSGSVPRLLPPPPAYLRDIRRADGHGRGEPCSTGPPRTQGRGVGRGVSWGSDLQRLPHTLQGRTPDPPTPLSNPPPHGLSPP